MIRKLDCQECGINQADTDKPFVALPRPFICQECYGRQISKQERIEELEAENQRLRNVLQWWVDVNEGAPNKYEWAKQALKAGGREGLE